jgi:hypothetical protein
MDSVAQYFKEEKKESVYFVCYGFVACLIGLLFLLIKKEPFYNAISYVFFAFGLIQLVVGSTVYLRCDLDTVRVSHFIEKEIKSIYDYEIPRMELVMKNFLIYSWIEIALIAIGIVLFLLFESKSFTKGLGIGLVIQSSIMLVLDSLAEKRGRDYLNYLMSLV